MQSLSSPSLSTSSFSDSSRVRELEEQIEELKRTNANLLTSSSSVSPSLPSSSTANFDIGAYRADILSKTTPFIIECAEAEAGKSQEACHLPRPKRFAALDQKGVTLWMTGIL